MIDLKHATDPISAEVSIPGSKSMTNRALLLAALVKVFPCSSTYC